MEVESVTRIIHECFCHITDPLLRRAFGQRARLSPLTVLHEYASGPHGSVRRSEAFGNLVREIAGPPCRLILSHARHVDEPPSARIPWPKTQRERSFGKHKPRAGRHVQDVGQRHEIVPRRAKAVQQDDDRTVASASAICVTGKANSEISELS